MTPQHIVALVAAAILGVAMGYLSCAVQVLMAG